MYQCIHECVIFHFSKFIVSLHHFSQCFGSPVQIEIEIHTTIHKHFLVIENGFDYCHKTTIFISWQHWLRNHFWLWSIITMIHLDGDLRAEESRTLVFDHVRVWLAFSTSFNTWLFVTPLTLCRLDKESRNRMLLFAIKMD